MLSLFCLHIFMQKSFNKQTLLPQSSQNAGNRETIAPFMYLDY